MNNPSPNYATCQQCGKTLQWVHSIDGAGSYCKECSEAVEASEHTPGPLHHTHAIPKMAAGIHIANGNCIGTAHNTADARLWAAAPDLYEACLAALEPAGDTPEQIRMQLRAAIAKAEGWRRWADYRAATGRMGKVI